MWMRMRTLCRIHSNVIFIIFLFFFSNLISLLTDIYIVFWAQRAQRRKKKSNEASFEFSFWQMLIKSVWSVCTKQGSLHCMYDCLTTNILLLDQQSQNKERRLKFVNFYLHKCICVFIIVALHTHSTHTPTVHENKRGVWINGLVIIFVLQLVSATENQHKICGFFVGTRTLNINV